MTRREQFIALLDELGIDPEGSWYSGEEDAGLYLDDEADDYPLERYAAETYAGEFVYVKLFPTFRQAADHAVSNTSDNLYAEAPGAVHDLDTGDTYLPDWSRLPWKLSKPVIDGPSTGAQC